MSSVPTFFKQPISRLFNAQIYLEIEFLNNKLQNKKILNSNEFQSEAFKKFKSCSDTRDQLLKKYENLTKDYLKKISKTQITSFFKPVKNLTAENNNIPIVQNRSTPVTNISSARSVNSFQSLEVETNNHIVQSYKKHKVKFVEFYEEYQKRCPVSHRMSKKHKFSRNNDFDGFYKKLEIFDKEKNSQKILDNINLIKEETLSIRNRVYLLRQREKEPTLSISAPKYRSIGASRNALSCDKNINKDTFYLVCDALDFLEQTGNIIGKQVNKALVKYLPCYTVKYKSRVAYMQKLL